MSKIYTIVLLLVTITGYAQKNRYVVYFTDKNGSEFTVENPSEFLSQRAILRRERQNIEVTPDDLPVNSWYLDSLKNAGAEVYYTSRWFNAALIQASGQVAQAITGISIVDSVAYAAPGSKLTSRSSSVQENASTQTHLLHNQLHGVDQMVADGYTGEGIWIAVMDAGFSGVQTIAAFNHLFQNQKLIMAKNLVDNDEQVFQYGQHGTLVLSLISGYIPEEYSGTAPDASIGLFLTEDEFSEYRIEEYNWLFAAEMADSAGFDIINTSLGYNRFDDASMNYTLEDLDGNTSVITRASNFAAARGILTVTSAGNEGSNDGDAWRDKITFPADAFENIAVGALNANLEKASFSSVGPTADGRIKPDLSAFGSSVSVIGADGNVTTRSGTSFASPIVAGMAAGIWQRFPNFTMAQLREQLLIWSSNEVPNNLTGYGALIYEFNGEIVLDIKPNINFVIYPNPVRDYLHFPAAETDSNIRLVNMAGQEIKFQVVNQKVYLGAVPAGIYILTYIGTNGSFTARIIKE